MKNVKTYAALASSIVMLTGCIGLSKDPSDKETKDAIRTALQANFPNETFTAMPVGKSVATNMDNARQLVIARKTGNDAGNDCADFNITVSRPSSQWQFFGQGDMNSGNAKICSGPQ